MFLPAEKISVVLGALKLRINAGRVVAHPILWWAKTRLNNVIFAGSTEEKRIMKRTKINTMPRQGLFTKEIGR
jgi:hypothetical protein